MAYNNGFPVGYPQFYPQNFNSQNFNPQFQQNTQPQMVPQQQAAPQIQNGGFMLIPSEDMARTYPVAPGNCVTFKIEGKPIVMEKSMGFSQLEAPKIERYRLVHEEDVPPEAPPVSPSEPEWKSEIRKLWGEIDVLKRQNEKLSELTKTEEDSGA